jgi:hypothetical protein
MTATLTAPSPTNRPHIVLWAMAAFATIAFVVVLAVALMSGSDSPAKEQAPTATTQVTESGSGSGAGSPDSIDRAEAPDEAPAQPSRAF